MTAQHERHMEQQIERFSRQFRVKYKVGQEEHGGALWTYKPLDLIRMAKMEVIDQWAYLDALEQRLLAEESDAGPMDEEVSTVRQGAD